MKDENGKDFSSYDLDRLLSEYTELGKEKDDVRNTEPPKKKFVVHIDESLIDSQEDENSKSSSGGVYFSNYQGSHGGRSPQKGKYTEVEVKREEDVPKNGIRKKINSYTAKKIEKIGGRTAAAFLAFIIISTTILSYVGITCVGDMLAINRSDEVVVVSIPDKASYSEIIDILSDNNLVKRKMFCKLFTKYRGFDDETYLSGNYYLNSKMGVEGMLKDLMAAPVTADTISLSFPEGWTIQQIFEKLDKNDVCDTNKLYTAIQATSFDYNFINNIADNKEAFLKLEGYMFPDTYDFYVDADTNYVVKKFLGNFNDKWTDEYDARAKKLGFTMSQIVTIASIIQKEAANAEQMKVVSSVIHNRLADPANYPTLNCDSTAIYISNYVTPIAGEAQGNKYYNYYDTSAVKGLPPGPICNPGLDAIEAALYPDSTDYYYFAHDKSGKIYLAQTYQGHKNNLVLIIKANNSK